MSDVFTKEDLERLYAGSKTGKTATWYVPHVVHVALVDSLSGPGGKHDKSNCDQCKETT